jgi:Ala-tRNA(Pro) deacylase
MTHMAPRALAARLTHEHVPFVLIPHRRTDTAAAEAEALGVERSQVAKTVVLTTPEGLVLAVLPASERLDLHKVRDILGEKDVQLATEETLAGAYPEFELGAVPPITGKPGDRVLVDRRLCENEYALVEAGTHDESLRLKTTDLLVLAEAQLADISQDA